MDKWQSQFKKKYFLTETKAYTSKVEQDDMSKMAQWWDNRLFDKVAIYQRGDENCYWHKVERRQVVKYNYWYILDLYECYLSYNALTVSGIHLNLKLKCTYVTSYLPCYVVPC